MREVTESQLREVLSRVVDMPRVVAGGNFSTPLTALSIVDASVPEYRLNILNAQSGIPDRPGVAYETAFVGPAMRGHPDLSYFPCRLSLVPYLLRQMLRPAPPACRDRA